LRSAGEEADELASGLTPDELWWRPAHDRWSVGECLDHLVRTGEAYLGVMNDAVEEGRRDGLLDGGSYRPGLLGRWLPRMLEPPPRLKIRAPRSIRPRRPAAGGPEQSPDADPLREFLALRDRLGERLQAADGLDLGGIRVASPFISFLRFDLGSAFRIVAAHERRHLWQARQVRKEDRFPAP
ncbi:MAG: DinB family protein, partial [Gemmatimonadota bacterium]